jgi:hypothetical protein
MINLTSHLNSTHSNPFSQIITEFSCVSLPATDGMILFASICVARHYACDIDLMNHVPLLTSELIEFKKVRMIHHHQHQRRQQ